jgi:hypothetical protein
MSLKALAAQRLQDIERAERRVEHGRNEAVPMRVSESHSVEHRSAAESPGAFDKSIDQAAARQRLELAAWWSRDGDGATASVRGYSRALRRPVLVLGALAPRPRGEDARLLVVRPHRLRSVRLEALLVDVTPTEPVGAPFPAAVPLAALENLRIT